MIAVLADVGDPMPTKLVSEKLGMESARGLHLRLGKMKQAGKIAEPEPGMWLRRDHPRFDTARHDPPAPVVDDDAEEAQAA